MDSDHNHQSRLATRSVDEQGVADLTSRLRGDVIVPFGEDYDTTRAVWNGLIDRRPALIVRCAGVADVIAAIEFSRNHALPIAVRGGGHSVAGSSSCDDCLLIDLSRMQGIRVDPELRIVRAEAGVNWGALDRETQAFGLAAPGGLVSDTGVAGLTLGGGLGWLRRKHGLSCDNLVSVDIVTTDGQFRKASRAENADLFWALRGGGGNFGVVTSFEFRLHPVGPNLFVAVSFYRTSHAKSVLSGLRDYMATAPDEVSPLATFWVVPPANPFPERDHGLPTLGVAAAYVGDVTAGERVLQPLRNLGPLIADLSTSLSYLELQTLFDEDYPRGRLYYWKSLFLRSLDDDVIGMLAERSVVRPSPLSSVDIWALGGEIKRIGPDETAFSSREEPYLVAIEANWDNPKDTEANIAWARNLWGDLQRFSTGALYVNFPGLGEEGDRLMQSTYGRNLQRLAAIKRKYDPDNLLRFNQNVKPA